MVDFRDLKWYDSQDGLGGDIDTGDEILTSTPNNVFDAITRAKVLTGETYYKCIYFKNTHATETMENFKIWISSATPLDYTSIAFSYDGVANPYNGAVGFDGTNDYIDCGNHSDLWSKALTKFSFKVSFYSTLSGDGNSRLIVSHGGTSNQAFRFFIDPSDASTVKFVIKDSGATEHTATATNHVHEGWNTYTCTYDKDFSSDQMRIYKGGVQVGEATFTGTINLSANLRLADDSNDFSGYMRDFEYWDNESINTTEAIELDENGDMEGKPPAYNLNFGEGTGSTAKDATSKIKTATLENGTFWAKDAQSIADEFTEPDTLVGWNIPGDPIQEGIKVPAGRDIPIWLRLTVGAEDTATPVIDDSAVFTIEFDIPATGTGSGGSGGTGGGTGGGTPTSTNWKMAVAGDWGTESETEDVIDLMIDEDYDFILGCGDNGYSDDDEWIDMFERFKSKFESAFGNHEYDDGVSNYRNFFGYSRTYNSFRFQNCLIITIDSNADENFPGWTTQINFLKSELEKYKNDSKVYWRIVAMHHPWFGNGGHHSPNEFDQVQKLHKICTDYDVNFVMTGHNHNWQRTHQVSYNSSNPEEPHVVDSSSPYDKNNNGLMMIVSGTGGHDDPGDLYDLPDDDDFFAYRNNNHNGVFELVASNNGKTLTGRFRDTNGDTHSSFTIE